MKADKAEFEPIKAAILPWQQNTVDNLLKLKNEQRLPHALLIEMRTATDSRAFGWYLVTTLLCENPRSGQPCGECAACHAMQSNNYPDFSFTTLLENERTHKLNKDIKIDQIRKLIHLMSLTNSLGSGKVALIYPAEKLNQSSANALLKTLEEPSSDTVLILLTHNSGRLPITIRSRCQQWVVQNPEQAEAQNWLESQGLQAAEAAEYLDLAQQDAQLASELFKHGFKTQYDRFIELLDKYQSDQIDVVTMAQSLKSQPADVLRIILRRVVQKMIGTALQASLTGALKQTIQAALNQLTWQERMLSIEDNNLNLQLQLEDVLISLKQIKQ
jgi:DNA polymerase-3 subunit delta'